MKTFCNMFAFCISRRSTRNLTVNSDTWGEVFFSVSGKMLQKLKKFPGVASFQLGFHQINKWFLHENFKPVNPTEEEIFGAIHFSPKASRDWLFWWMTGSFPESPIILPIAATILWSVDAPLSMQNFWMQSRSLKNLPLTLLVADCQFDHSPTLLRFSWYSLDGVTKYDFQNYYSNGTHGSHGTTVTPSWQKNMIFLENITSPRKKLILTFYAY